MEVAVIVLAVAVVVAALILARRPSPPVPDATGAIAAALSSMAGRLEQGAQRDEEMTRMVLRIERLFAGSYSRGRGGENLLAAALADFPPEMVVRNFTIGGRVCEFALRMSNGKLLPIDSKWTGGTLLAELAQVQAPEEREALRRAVEKGVCDRLKEVAGYIDPSHTLPMAVAAVPDAAFACLRKAHDAARRMRVVIVSYSFALPYLLTTWNLHRTYSREIETDQLLARVQDASDCLAQLGDRIESHLSKGLTMAQNAAGEMKALVSSAKVSLESISRSEGFPKGVESVGEGIGSP